VNRIVSIDGAILPPGEARVSVYDRGFLYGDSVFETVRTYGGEPFALAEHLARLERSAALVGIAMPIPATDFGMEIRLAVRAARNAGPRWGSAGLSPALPQTPESYARAMLTRGSGPVGLDPALAGDPLRVVLVEPLTPLPAAFYRDGVAVVTVRTERAADAAHGAKVGNYLASLLALKEARARGAHEALILDTAGRVVEGTTSNVFIVRGGEIVTPPEEAGILAGITRAHLIDVAAEIGRPLHLAPLTPGDLAAADEVFVCSSLREVVPVVRVDDHAVAGGRPGPVTRALHAAFRARAGLGADPMPWE
jgi:branched-chain amino acid aminotransferase